MFKNREQCLMQSHILLGIKPVFEMLTHEPNRILKVFFKKNINAEIKKMIRICHENHIPFEMVEISALDAICKDPINKNVAHQGVVATLSAAKISTLFELFKSIENSPIPLLIALDQVQDPGNVGTLYRTAYALGCAGMILPLHNCSSLGPAVIKSSAGAIERLPTAIVTNLSHALDEAEESGLYIYGTSSKSSAKPNKTETHIYANAFEHHWQLPAVIVLGNESRGIRPGVTKRCATMLTIPFARNFESLNVAQAGSILLGLCARQVLISK